MALFNYECDEVKHIIDEVSPNYPQLTTYEKEWLYFHKYGYIPGIPVKLEYETINVNPYGMVLNAIPFQYKSAILKGKTDENLQSVKMPVLKTTGKNLFNINGELITIGVTYSINGDSLTVTGDWFARQVVDLKPNTTYTLSYEKAESDSGYIKVAVYTNGTSEQVDTSYTNKLIFTTPPSFKDISVIFYAEEGGKTNTVTYTNIQLEEGSVATSYEPHKSNILTCNEDVTLRSNGNICDELNLLTGQLTQRIDEDGEVLSQEVVKTVDLTPLNEPYEGTNHYELTSNIPCEAILEVPVVSTGKQTLEEING